MRSKVDLIAELRRLLHEAFVGRAEGGSYHRLAHAQGSADGYMRALLDSGMCTQRELLAIVADERARVSGPGSRELVAEPVVETIAA